MESTLSNEIHGQLFTQPIIELLNCTKTSSLQITTVSLASDNTNIVRNQQTPTVSLRRVIASPTTTNDEPPVVTNAEDVVMSNTNQLSVSKLSDDVVMTQNMNEERLISKNSTKEFDSDGEENMVDYSDAPLSDEDNHQMCVQVATDKIMYNPAGVLERPKQYNFTPAIYANKQVINLVNDVRTTKDRGNKDAGDTVNELMVREEESKEYLRLKALHDKKFMKTGNSVLITIK